MLHIGAGQEISTTYDGQTINVVGQGAGESISLISAKTDGVVTGKSVQLLRNIKPSDPNIKVTAKMNANYFVMSDGQALGVRCGLDEWSVPRQNAWYYYALLKNGVSQVLMDTAFWYTKADCVFACSPAEVLIYHGQIVNYISPSAEGSKNTPTTQSMLIRTNERFAFAVCSGKLSPEQCRQWALTIDGIQDLCLMDSGGSACLEADGKMLVSTGRAISNALCFYKFVTDDGGEEDDSKMPLYGIDISNWQAGLDLRKIKFDFVIAKATEGVNFVDKYCDSFIQTAKSMGKLWGFYHFARPSNDAVQEARYFYENTSAYFGEGIPVLDWEAENKQDVQWALRWLNEVYRLSGVKPLIYMSESVVNTYDWSPVVSGDYGLWVAKYRDSQPDYNYDMSLAGSAPKVKWWSGYAMWQWTSVGRLDGYSGSLDCDVFYGDKKAWLSYAKSQPVQDDGGEDTPTDDIASLKAEIASLRAENEKYAELLADYADRISRALNALKGETK